MIPKQCEEFLPTPEDYGLKLSDSAEGLSVLFVGYKVTSKHDYVDTEIADKQEVLSILITRYPHANSNVPRAFFTASYVSGLYTICNATSNSAKVYEAAKLFIQRMKDERGYVYEWCHEGIKKLYNCLWRHNLTYRAELLHGLRKVASDVYNTAWRKVPGLRNSGGNDCHIIVNLQVWRAILDRHPFWISTIRRTEVGALVYNLITHQDQESEEYETLMLGLNLKLFPEAPSRQQCANETWYLMLSAMEDELDSTLSLIGGREEVHKHSVTVLRKLWKSAFYVQQTLNWTCPNKKCAKPLAREETHTSLDVFAAQHPTHNQVVVSNHVRDVVEKGYSEVEKASCIYCESALNKTALRSVKALPYYLPVDIIRWSQGKPRAKKLRGRAVLNKEITVKIPGGEEARYHCFAIVLHHGDYIHGGHFTCLTESTIGAWNHYDDDRAFSKGQWYDTMYENTEIVRVVYIRTDVPLLEIGGKCQPVIVRSTGSQPRTHSGIGMTSVVTDQRSSVFSEEHGMYVMGLHPNEEDEYFFDPPEPLAPESESDVEEHDRTQRDLLALHAAKKKRDQIAAGAEKGVQIAAGAENGSVSIRTAFVQIVNQITEDRRHDLEVSRAKHLQSGVPKVVEGRLEEERVEIPSPHPDPPLQSQSTGSRQRGSVELLLEPQHVTPERHLVIPETPTPIRKASVGQLPVTYDGVDDPSHPAKEQNAEQSVDLPRVVDHGQCSPRAQRLTEVGGPCQWPVKRMCPHPATTNPATVVALPETPTPGGNVSAHAEEERLIEEYDYPPSPPAPPSLPQASAAPSQSPPSKAFQEVIHMKLYRNITRIYPEQAAKITGMLLELDNAEIVNLLESPDLLLQRVEEAVEVLQQVKGAPIKNVTGAGRDIFYEREGYKKALLNMLGTETTGKTARRGRSSRTFSGPPPTHGGCLGRAFNIFNDKRLNETGKAFNFGGVQNFFELESPPHTHTHPNR